MQIFHLPVVAGCLTYFQVHMVGTRLDGRCHQGIACVEIFERLYSLYHKLPDFLKIMTWLLPVCRRRKRTFSVFHIAVNVRRFLIRRPEKHWIQDPMNRMLLHLQCHSATPPFPRLLKHTTCEHLNERRCSDPATFTPSSEARWVLGICCLNVATQSSSYSKTWSYSTMGGGGGVLPEHFLLFMYK